MMSLKSKLVNATLAATAAIPLATAGMFISSGSAQAYTGSFNYNPFINGTTPPITPTTVTLSNTSINFSPNPGAILLTNQTGDFASDFTGFIKSFAINPFTSPSPFIDVAGLDGIKQLSLTSLNPAVFSPQNGGTNINLSFKGIFEDGSKAEGFITFATQVVNAENKYTAGNTIAASFTGLAVTSVPEPGTVLGLGLVGAGMLMSRRRKSVTQ